MPAKRDREENDVGSFAAAGVISAAEADTELFPELLSDLGGARGVARTDDDLVPSLCPANGEAFSFSSGATDDANFHYEPAFF